MKSTRLTKENKEMIAKKIISDAYDKKKKALEEERYAFSEKVYADIYEKNLEQINNLPSGWLIESNEFMVQFGSSSTGYCQRMLKNKKRFLAKDTESYRQCLKIYDDGHKFTKIHDDLTDKIDFLKEEIKKSEREVWAMLNSCNTTKQLKEAWPEITKYVENFEPASERTTAIAPIIGDLNERLGLKESA